MISAEQAIREKHSATCAPCMQPKVKGAYFCGRCWTVLPSHMREAMNQKIGMGYERAYDEAVRCIRQRLAGAKDIGAGRHSRIDYRR